MGNKKDLAGCAGNIFAIAVVLLVVVICLFAVETGSGKIVSKWQETSTSCDSKGVCSTDTTLYIQLENGAIYVVFLKLDWDKMVPGMFIAYEARGPRLNPFMIRMITPTIYFNAWRPLYNQD